MDFYLIISVFSIYFRVSPAATEENVNNVSVKPCIDWNNSNNNHIFTSHLHFGKFSNMVSEESSAMSSLISTASTTGPLQTTLVSSLLHFSLNLLTQIFTINPKKTLKISIKLQ
jgi:hypothetical protein